MRQRDRRADKALPGLARGGGRLLGQPLGGLQVLPPQVDDREGHVPHRRRREQGPAALLGEGEGVARPVGSLVHASFPEGHGRGVGIGHEAHVVVAAIERQAGGLAQVLSRRVDLIGPELRDPEIGVDEGPDVGFHAVMPGALEHDSGDAQHLVEVATKARAVELHGGRVHVEAPAAGR